MHCDYSEAKFQMRTRFTHNAPVRNYAQKKNDKLAITAGDLCWHTWLCSFQNFPIMLQGGGRFFLNRASTNSPFFFSFFLEEEQTSRGKQMHKHFVGASSSSSSSSSSSAATDSSSPPHVQLVIMLRPFKTQASGSASSVVFL